MATTQDGPVVSIVAAAALTKGQAVYMTSSGVNVATAATHWAIGTVEKDTASGGMAPVRLFAGNVVKGIASAAIAMADFVTPTTGGKWVTWSSGAGAKHICIKAGGADGDWIEIILGALGTA